MKTRFYVCGLGYDVNGNITDYEKYFGDYDTYEKAYEVFVQLQCRDIKSFFVGASNVKQVLIQIEECVETKDAITCIEVKNEWWIDNPNFKEEFDMKNLTYSEFCLWLDENDDRVEYILEYDNWSVVKIDGRYYYYEHEVEGDSDEFYEVFPITSLHYNIWHDVKIDNLHELFECTLCGEQVVDDEIIYWWFE